MTYAQENDKEKINWAKEIRFLFDNFDEELFNKSKTISNEWYACPIGQLNSVIPRHSDGEPRDRILLMLGTRFLEEFREQNFEECLNLIKLIKIRAKKVLRDTVSDYEDSINEFYKKLGKKSPLA